MGTYCNNNINSKRQEPQSHNWFCQFSRIFCNNCTINNIFFNIKSITMENNIRIILRRNRSSTIYCIYIPKNPCETINDIRRVANYSIKCKNYLVCYLKVVILYHIFVKNYVLFLSQFPHNLKNIKCPKAISTKRKTICIL